MSPYADSHSSFNSSRCLSDFESASTAGMRQHGEGPHPSLYPQHGREAPHPDIKEGPWLLSPEHEDPRGTLPSNPTNNTSSSAAAAAAAAAAGPGSRNSSNGDVSLCPYGCNRSSDICSNSNSNSSCIYTPSPRGQPSSFQPREDRRSSRTKLLDSLRSTGAVLPLAHDSNNNNPTQGPHAQKYEPPQYPLSLMGKKNEPRRSHTGIDSYSLLTFRALGSMDCDFRVYLPPTDTHLQQHPQQQQDQHHQQQQQRQQQQRMTCIYSWCHHACVLP